MSEVHLHTCTRCGRLCPAAFIHFRSSLRRSQPMPSLKVERERLETRVEPRNGLARSREITLGQKMPHVQGKHSTLPTAY